MRSCPLSNLPPFKQGEADGYYGEPKANPYTPVDQMDDPHAQYEQGYFTGSERRKWDEKLRRERRD